MNERIENLAQGCFEYFEGTLDGDIVEFDYKKFAELIVRECMTIGFNTVYKVDDDSAALAVYQNIKEHFGVKE